MSYDDSEFELFEKMYFHEIQVRNEFSERVNAPLAILVALIGAIAFMLQSVNINVGGLALFLFALPYSFAIIFASCAVYGMTRALSGHTYLFVAKADEWHKMLSDLREYYQATNQDPSGSLLEVKSSIIDRYVICATKNAELNDRRSQSLYLCNSNLIKGVVAVAVAFAILQFSGLNKADEPHRAVVTIEKN